jgi:L-rhamnose isomerase
MKMYEASLVTYRAEEAQRKRKAEERKASAGGGKQYTQNVKG